MSEQRDRDLAQAVTWLMKGIVHRDSDPRVWQLVLAQQAQVRDYVAVMGLTAVVDEAEGYAFLRQRSDPGDSPEETGVPRLIARRALPYAPSLLLALLRKRLAEADATSTETRLLLTREQIADMLLVFLPTSTHHTRLVDHVDALIARVVEMGFLRPVDGGGQQGGQQGGQRGDQFEVRRVLKAYVDAQWLSDFDARLAGYRTALEGGHVTGGDPDPGVDPDPGADPRRHHDEEVQS
ncbi:uncharacterized protein DUF4194 [Kineococcus xinjiangensis]|uniref:Uncharacterized protein DUF4194 n=1 Tax=Kineococcus xinjiangensis TaxID=512762 RepID=A0A2S6IPH9_9ACTN|nr:DUF4194 domain-containing protein [Kineococcus xinjiangensis]PPK96162.1 uncharacterized protein DUF4194 [Kineococcus xinjiangensis]